MLEEHLKKETEQRHTIVSADVVPYESLKHVSW